jgi:ligand-binding sensor domain-containing protein
MVKREWCLGALVVLLNVVGTAGPGTWKNYTSMKDVRGLSRTGEEYWAATSGGLFGWDAGTGTFELYTNADGLLDIDLTAVAIDESGRVWAGSSGGYLHVLSPSDGTLRTVLDIAQSTQINKRINTCTVVGDTVLIGTDFGLSVFRSDKMEFGDTYQKFGPGSSGTRFAVLATAVFERNLWVCITDGLTINRVAYASLDSPNLLPPESWTVEIVGSTNEIPGSLAVFSGTLYVGTSNGLYARMGGTWLPVAQLQGQGIAGLTAGTASLAVATTLGATYTVDAQGGVTLRANGAPYPLLSVTTDPDGLPVAGSQGGGMLFSQSGWTSRFPNGPNSNQFTSVAVDPDGVVWVAAGAASSAGFYRYDGVSWKSFTITNSPLLTSAYFHASVDCSGNVWMSSFGRGLVEIPFRSDRVDSTNLYYTNVGMVGLPNDPAFVVPSNVVCDSRGNRWTSIIQPVNRRTLAVRRTDGSWLTMPTMINGTAISILVDPQVEKDLAVDAFDNLWAVVRDPSFRGVISFGNRGAIDSVSSFLVTSADGLPSDDIRTIIVDKENDLWVGTDKGIGIILDPENPKRTGGIAAYRPLVGLVINTIAVDALNQKWVGTNEGVVLLSPDGTQVLANYTVDNTHGKLISDKVTSIATDEASGTMYFGTQVGLSSLTTTAAAPKADFDVLKVYPNPYRVPAESPLTIDGLVASSSLKILTSDGRLVRDLTTPGGRIGFWDGKDVEGNVVASGIYIIVAYGEDGAKVGDGKVAVLHK